MWSVRSAAPRLHRSASTASCSPFASASSAARCLCPLNCCSPIVSASATAHRLCLLQLLLTTCVRFSRLRLLQLLPDCVRFGCCSPIVSTSTAAPRLRPLRLLLPAPIASASTAAPRLCLLQLLLPDCVHLYSASDRGGGGGGGVVKGHVCVYVKGHVCGKTMEQETTRELG